MKNFKHKRLNGHIYLLNLGSGLFGRQWDVIGIFTDNKANRSRLQKVVRILNEADNDREGTDDD